jgi:hypothetical protein
LEKKIEELNDLAHENDKKILELEREVEDLKHKLAMAEKGKQLLRSSSEVDYRQKLDKIISDLNRDHEEQMEKAKAEIEDLKNKENILQE